MNESKAKGGHKRSKALSRQQMQRRQRRFKRAIFALAALVLVFLLFGSVTVLGLSAWNDFDANRITNASQTMLLYDDHDRLITGVYGVENRQNVPLSQIPSDVQNALIAMEDLRFYEHSGIDVRRIFGALWADLKAGSLDQGASTITQQLIKLSHLSPTKTWTRKIQEAALAIQMERHFTKDQILEMYLNFVYFGAGAYGIEAAAEEYFDKDCSQLTTAESALLVGILKAPSRYAPHLHLENAVKRRNLILSQMRAYGFLDETAYQEAVMETVTLHMRDDAKYPHGFYVELAMKEARDVLRIDQETLLSGGYRIYTSLDTKLQEHCEQLFADDTLFPAPINDKRPEAAVVFIDPRSFQIQALLGGREHLVKLGLNRATQVRRQPGSAIKPLIVYAPALERFGYTAASFLIDEPTDFNGYSPRNFNNSYNGWVTVRKAVTSSLNVPAVKVLSDIGVSTGKAFCESIGITFDEKDTSLPLALGGFTYGVTPLEIGGAYTALASGGLYEEPLCVRKITSADGKVLYENERTPTRVMSEENAFIMTSILQSVITDGTGRRLNVGIPLAGKTGTTGLVETGGNKDAWMIAYNPEHVAALWMGFDDTNSVYSLPSEATGGTYPAALLARVFEQLYPNPESAPAFMQPDGVVEVALDAASLNQRQQIRLSNALTPDSQVAVEYFTKATVPNRSTDYWVVPAPPGGLSIAPSPYGKPEICFTPEDRLMLYRLYRMEGELRTVLGEFPGDNGEIRFTDQDTLYGHTYEYYVVPVHPELTISGEQVEGPPSHSVRFTVEYPSPGIAANAPKDESLGDAQSRLSPTPAATSSPTTSPRPSASASPAMTKQPATSTPPPAPSPTPTRKPTATPSPAPKTEPPDESSLSLAPEDANEKKATTSPKSPDDAEEGGAFKLY